MKPFLVAMMILGSAAPLPAQFFPGACNPYGSNYDAGICLMQRMGQNRMAELQFLSQSVLQQRSQWNNIEAQYPPLIVDSRPGQRVAPQIRAKGLSGPAPKFLMESDERNLSEFAAAAIADPDALARRPPNHLATAVMLYLVRNYMAARALSDVSVHLAQGVYYASRVHTASPEFRTKYPTAESVQALYEDLLLKYRGLDTSYQAARAKGDRAGLQMLETTGLQSLSAALGNDFDRWMRWADSSNRTDGDFAVQGPRVTLSPFSRTAPAVVSAPQPKASLQSPRFWIGANFVNLRAGSETTKDAQNKSDFLVVADRELKYARDDANWTADGWPVDKEKFHEFIQQELGSLREIDRREPRGPTTEILVKAFRNIFGAETAAIERPR